MSTATKIVVKIDSTKKSRLLFKKKLLQMLIADVNKNGYAQLNKCAHPEPVHPTRQPHTGLKG